MSEIRTDSGHVLAVSADPLGSSLVDAHTAGVTVLTVEDCADFDDTVGGTLSLDGVTYTYSDVDDEASTMTINPALAADAEDGSPVALLNPLTGDPTFEWGAQVTLDGIDPGGPLLAGIRSSLVSQLSSSIRGITGEAVALQWDEDETLWVVDILTGSPVDDTGHAVVVGSVRFEDTDTFTVTVAGDQSWPLSFLPLPGSVHMARSGLWQPHTALDVDYTTGIVTVADSPAGINKVGRLFDFRYAHRGETYTPPPPDPPNPVLIGVTELQDARSSIALPAGTAAGDLIVVSSMTLQTATTSDPRLTGSLIYGAYAGAWWGTADGSGAPLAVNFTSAPLADFCATTLAVYRGVTVARTAAFAPGSATPVSAPTIAGAQAAVAVVLGRNNVAAGTLSGDTSLAWTHDAFCDDGKSHSRLAHWVSSTGPASTPPGSWGMSGDMFNLGAATLELVTA